MSTPPGQPAAGRFNKDAPHIRAVRWFFRRFPRAHWWGTFLPRVVASDLFARYASLRGNGRSLKKLRWQDHKTSDTVFILATGASINRYDERRWSTVAAHDSIGLNFFMLHDHVPTLYVMENQYEQHRALLAAKHESHKHVPLILSAQLGNLSFRRFRDRMERIALNPPEIRRRIYLSHDLLPAGNEHEDMVAAYKIMERAGLFTVRRRFRVLTKRRGSIAHLINMAVRAGYRRIVLCGVDLNHAEYFYDSLREELEAKGLPVPPNTQTGVVHDTNDPDVKKVTIKDVVLTIDNEILRPRGIELYVGDASSDLHPEVPEYPWHDG